MKGHSHATPTSSIPLKYRRKYTLIRRRDDWHHFDVQKLEPRTLFSGSNALDRLDFGNLASEAAHNFEAGVAASHFPVLGAGTVGASAGITYRDPTNGQDLTFILAVDSTKQNYFTVKFWGNDAPATVTLADSTDAAINGLETAGGAVIYPNRFYYYTYAIPIALTQSRTSVALHLDIAAPGKPVYSVFSSTDPAFVPDSTDTTGTQPTMTGVATLTALSAAKAVGTTASPGILLSSRQAIYGTNGTYSQVLARQITTANAPNAPPEVIGLDLFTNVASWVAANPNATADQWRQQIANTEAGGGYTAFPDELLSMLMSTYLLQPFVDSNGNTVSGLDDYHDPSLITKIVSAIDGASYEQDLDGGFIQQGADAAANSAWTGLTSAARTTGSFAGSAARQNTTHGGGDLQGFDTYGLGWSLLSLLNDPTAAPILTTYLNQSYNADLNGTLVLRATAYERMLYNAVKFYQSATGGTESQNMFQESAMYACDVALGKLQALFPNAAYPANSATALKYVKELVGLIPDTDMRGIGFNDDAPYAASTLVNYGLTADGFGEAHGALSTGFDGGGYGQMLPTLLPRIVKIATWDTTIDNGTLSSIEAAANDAINSIDQFFFPMDNAVVNSNGVETSDTFSFNAEPYITYRDPKNLNVYAGSLNFDAQYPASDPNGSINNAYALRSAYLETEYGVTPIIGFTSGYTATSSLDFMRNLPAYESTIRSLINVNPATLTRLPGEINQSNFAFADVQAGAVAFINNGERFYANLDWRNYEYNNNSLVNIVASQQARFDYSNGTTEIAGQLLMPATSAGVQSDGNLTSTADLGAKVLRYGNYLIILNDGIATYNATLPVGLGFAQDLISKNVYSLSTSGAPTIVSIAAGKAAILWLKAANTLSSLGAGVDVGAVGITGADSYSAGVYTVTGAGADIGETADAFHFVPTNANGNATIMAEVLAQTASNSLAQAGVMLRDGTSASAAFAAVVRTPGGGVRFIYRNTVGTAASWVAVPDPLSPVYVKLTRNGNSISGYESSDGISWNQIGTTQNILMSSPEIGLAVSSHSMAATSTAAFSNVSLEAGVSPTIGTAASASATTVVGTSVDLAVVGADAGGESNLIYTWALLGTPPDQVTYSANGTNTAKNTTATFATAGTYNFIVFIQNASGAYVTSTLNVMVVQTATGVTLSTPQAQVPNSSSYPYYATISDQFGHPLEQPGMVTWSINAGLGSVDQSGTYVAPASGTGAAVVLASYGTLSGTSTVTVVANAPVALWHLDSNFTDSSGNGHALTGVNSPTFSTGEINTAITFNGTNQYATATPGVLTTSQPYSVSAWVNWNGNTGYNTAVSQDGTNVSAFFLQYRGDTHQFSFTTLGTDSTSAATYTAQWTTVPTANTWYYLVGVYTGSQIQLYVNGTLAATTSVAASFSATGSTVLGASKFGSGTRVDYFHGSVDEVQLFSRALTATDVSTLYGSPPTFSNVTDIGAPSPAGTYSQTNGVITMTGGGVDIYGTSDAFTMAYVPIVGDATVTARVVSMVNTNTNAKAGVMIRSSLAAGSPEVSSLVTASNGINLDYRTALNGSSSETKITGLTAPYWVRVVRSGNSFSAYRSVDGTTWIQTGATVSITIGSTVYVGLAVCSHLNGTSTTATFDNVTITGTADAAPTLITAASATTNPVAGKTANLTTLGTDDAGESNLIYTWNLVNLPPGNVSFSANGTNAAKNTTVTFTKSGTYVFKVTITDGGGLSVANSSSLLVIVSVNQSLTSIVVTPAGPTIAPAANQQFLAVGYDQFGAAMVVQPTITWSTTSGVGTINSSTGLYSASATDLNAGIRATSGSVFGSTIVTITNQAPLIATSAGASAGAVFVPGNTANLSVSAVDDVGSANLIYTWSVMGTPPLPVTFSVNGTTAAQNTTATFNAIGTYTLQVTVTDTNGTGLSVTSSVNVIVSTIQGTSGNDNIRLVRSGINLAVYINSTTVTYTVPYASLGAISVSPGSGTDVVNVDFSGGSTPVPLAGLTVDGSNGIDTLIVTGSTGDDTSAINSTAITMNGSPIAYTGIESIVVDGNGGNDSLTQTAQPGDNAALAFNGMTTGGPSSADSLDVSGGVYSFVPPSTSNSPLNLQSLSIDGTASVIVNGDRSTSNRWVLVLGSLNITTATAQLDLGGNDMIVRGGSISTISGLLASGFNGVGTWNGAGIASSAAHLSTTHLTTLGVLQNSSASTFDGQMISPGDILVKYTYYGDANLDGKVDGSDYSRIDSGFLTGGSGWINGDFQLRWCCERFGLHAD